MKQNTYINLEKYMKQSTHQSELGQNTYHKS